MSTRGQTDDPPRASQDRGRHALSPWRIPPAGWKEVLVRTWNESWSDNLGLVAAGVAFYWFLAFVPMLGIIVLAYGLVVEPATVVSHMQTLTTMLPDKVSLFIGRELMNLVATSEQTKGLGLLGALAVALYGGANGAGAIITALNVAYEEKEKRSLFRFYALAIVITVAAFFLALAALAATVLIRLLEALIPQSSTLALGLYKGAAYLVLTLAAAAVAATLYRFGPSRDQARWEWLTPGSLFTAVGWMLFTLGFGVYVTRLTDYNATYGSLGTVIVLLTWMYLSAYVFVFGAELNRELEHQTAEDSTVGPPAPLGERGAWAADHVAGMVEDGSENVERWREPGRTLGRATPGE